MMTPTLLLIAILAGPPAAEARTEAAVTELAALKESIARWNEAERMRRREFYDSLSSQERQDETFEEHLERYGMLVRMRQPATNAEIAAIEARFGSPLPAEVVALYREFGGLDFDTRGSSGFSIPSPAELTQRLALKDGWQRMPTLGLVSMIHAAWGGNRWDFDPAQRVLTTAQLERLDHDFLGVGYISWAEGEGRRYLYFDRHGRTGVFDHHQDDEDLGSAVAALLSGGSAETSLIAALTETIDSALREDDEEDED